MIRRLIARLRYKYDIAYGTTVFIPYDKLTSILEARPRSTWDEYQWPPAKYRFGTSLYGDINPEVKQWLDEHGPNSFENYSFGFSSDDLARQLLYQVENSSLPYCVRFCFEEDATLFKLTWL